MLKVVHTLRARAGIVTSSVAFVLGSRLRRFTVVVNDNTISLYTCPINGDPSGRFSQDTDENTQRVEILSNNLDILRRMLEEKCLRTIGSKYHWKYHNRTVGLR